uniref:Alpha-glucan phosphorylase H isozyme n=1 Tax=Rhizophora mucronata TaxID=61149 RepID=A0A2P2L3S9_RHIMU
MEVGLVPLLYEAITDALCSGVEGLLWLKLERGEMRIVLCMVVDIGRNLCRFTSQGVCSSGNHSRNCKSSCSRGCTAIVFRNSCHYSTF